MKRRVFSAKQAGIAVLMLSGSIAGCSSGNLPQLPTATTQPSLTKNVRDYKYLIGPGDSLSIFIWGNPEISGSYTVRPDGMISTSLVEDVPASGRTPTDLARSLEARLAEYIRDPIVTVMVSGFIGPYSEQVRVIGEASQPQAINYRENMTLLDVMVQVGGLTDYADGNDARLIRVVNGRQQQYGLRMGDLIRDGDITANIDILPGDIVIIPESWF
ncbi:MULTISPECIES: XrtA/PEP-CTERM system exopolysaccharide export protein [Photobacterium]|uniref:Sugar ABC transporter substrate-binding protein n=1 Tax=Photobacterium ganghwense TaxID=320778 RepID=A0A0J1HGY6_9GAMM|nr:MULTISPECIES: XrtA/PEP-CTERM system exopolysaccharide export protein [Photobacterium]KLV10879.1 sugar ABC transporter substrate-binding protein [Photobacterium ganghwense]MBV1842072.1 polysaccharide export protein [Photobacterium ganghwense]PSU10938.1 sugar ABC transporter substrate-binding protein [Photobacterium ganghwense]QSV13043.1 polysaccharide export protein [Photobacterium ganghwense]